MADVTIVTEDAERLVREGGVVNRKHRDFPTRANPGDAATVLGPKAPGGPFNDIDDVTEVGTVQVVDVHHADDCETFDGPAIDLPEWSYCHEEAEPDRWHWVCEPIEGGA